MDSKKSSKQLSTFVRFTGLGLQMGLTIYLGSLIGGWLDKNYPADWISYYKVITLFCVFGSIYSVIRQVIKLGKEEDKKEGK